LAPAPARCGLWTTNHGCALRGRGKALGKRLWNPPPHTFGMLRRGIPNVFPGLSPVPADTSWGGFRRGGIGRGFFAGIRAALGAGELGGRAGDEEEGRWRGYCFRPAWMPAVSIPWGFAKQNPKPKSGMDAAALGRQDVGCFQCWSLREAQTPKGEKTAGGRFFARARARRGAEQPRREAAGPERSGAPYSPVFCGAAAKNAPKTE
jgi:hypothetical protein